MNAIRAARLVSVERSVESSAVAAPLKRGHSWVFMGGLEVPLLKGNFWGISSSVTLNKEFARINGALLQIQGPAMLLLVMQVMAIAFLPHNRSSVSISQ